MRKHMIIIFIILLGIILYSTYNISISKENLEDIKKIKIGMHINQVKKVMRNTPSKQDEYDFEPEEFISLYQSPIGSSGDFSITYNKKDSIVKRVYIGD